MMWRDLAMQKVDSNKKSKWSEKDFEQLRKNLIKLVKEWRSEK